MLAKRLITHALPRLLVAFAALVGAVQVFRLVVLPAMASLFELGDGVTSGVRRIGVLASALLAYWAYVRFVEKRPARELHPRPVMIAAGAASGAGLIGLSMAVFFSVGVYEVTATPGLQRALWGVAVVIAVAATLEEIAFRGLLFGILERACGTVPALWLQSLAFALIHISNVGDRASTQELATTVASITLLGALWTLVYVHARSLWVVAANHAAWNFTIILSGLPLSGLDSWLDVAPLVSQARGPAWLSGGIGGPENAALTLVLVTLCVVGLLRWAKARGRFVVIPDPGPT